MDWDAAPMSFLRNAWYVAAWSHEVAHQSLFARTILDIPVVLFRNDDKGGLRAFVDRCPHRFAPLSAGRLLDGGIQCPYHGLQFDADGACVRNMFAKSAPAAAKLTPLPVAEKSRAIWVWPGDPDRADPATIPEIVHHDDPMQRCVFGVTRTKADYRLISDNLLDLTHTAMLHPALGGADYIPKFKSWEENERIVCDYVLTDVPNFVAEMLPCARVTHRDQIHWQAPSTHLLYSTTQDAADANQTVSMPSAHILTPETATSTHYFWSSAQPKDSPLSDADYYEVLRYAFEEEDKPMVELVQSRMGQSDLWALNPVLLATDAGSVRMRRKLDALIAAEQHAAGQQSRPASGAEHVRSA